MKGKQFFSLVSIILVLLGISSSFALQEGFEVSSTQNVAACASAITSASISITNTGDIESSYSIAASGSAFEFARFSETAFTLKLGETKTLFVYFSPKTQGNYQLETTITTVLGLQKRITHSIAVQKCQNIQLNVITPFQRTNPCQVSQFSFDIKNTGQYAETYRFGVKGLEAYATLSTNNVLLAPGEQAQVDVFVNPACEIYGKKEITFQTLATTSQYLAETKVVLDIVRNYEYAVVIPAQATICNAKQTALPISIVNNVPFTNQYDITVRGPSWLMQEARMVELGPLGNGITNLIAQATNPGNYTADITTESVRGEVVKRGTENIIVENCYDADVNIEQPSDIIVAGHSAQYTVTIKNEGTKEDSYELKLDAPSWVSASAQPLQLKAGESKTITLSATPSLNNTRDYKTIVSVISSETGTTTVDEIKLHVASAEEAYNIAISPQHTRVLYGQDVVALKLYNKGLLPATYDLAFKGPAFATLLASTITLQPEQKEVIYIQTDTQDSDQVADYEAQVTATIAGEIGFVSTFAIKLRQLTVAQEVALFVQKYLVFIVIGAVVLVLLILIAIFGRRIARAFRNWRIKRKEIAKIKAELRAKRLEEKRARKLIKESLKKSQPPTQRGRKIAGILMVLVALILLTGATLSIAGYGPLIAEVFKAKSESKFEPIIQVNTTGLEAFGNAVIIRGKETTIPIMVKNNFEDDVVFNIAVEDSWISTDVSRIELEPGEQETINLRVTPDETTKGLYKVTVSAALEQEDKILTENIMLNIKQRNLLGDFMSYVWYVVLGIVALIVSLFIKRKAKKQKEIKEGKIEFSKIKYKPARKIQVSLSKKK